ncbi:Periplasmic divalent cation tolerance protein cutA [Planctomycetales bacterium 10988]|nr:Periplasmic divalent cation tolerance protein cutA [Planctomycetales bacterium 10988]
MTSRSNPISSDYVIVTTTVENKKAAHALAKMVVERKLAACAQVFGPIQSVYRWKEEVQESEEWMCSMKTSQALYARLERAIQEQHTYDEPEIIATAVVAGSVGYLTWLQDNLLEESP